VAQQTLDPNSEKQPKTPNSTANFTKAQVHSGDENQEIKQIWKYNK
jgi:hypothetical protein